MHLPASLLELFAGRQAYHVCPLLETNSFIDFCRKRNVEVSAPRLQKLERLDLFYPIVRVYRPDLTLKIESVEGGRRYRVLGVLQDGECWSGETRTELADFGFEREHLRSWREEGYAWDPRAFRSPHLESLTAEPERHQAYYSRFQIEYLDSLLSVFTWRIGIEDMLDDNGAIAAAGNPTLVQEMAQHAQQLVSSRSQITYRDIRAPLCQLISDRYYPKTQSDERRFTLSNSLEPGKWDWYAYARAWDARDAVNQFGLTQEELQAAYERLCGTLRHSDPLARWASLTRFVSVEKRNLLAGDALRALTYREMAEMLRLLHRDTFGEQLPEPHDVGHEIFHRIPDISPEADPLRALELVANDFGVNPKPKLVLIVEGRTEEAIIPMIFDRLFAAAPSVFSIEIVNLGGVSNAAGTKENPASALHRLIDYLHHHQIITIVLMDNENQAWRNLRTGLPGAKSLYFPDRRVTRPEYVKLWRQSLELDNFSNAEVANALSQQGGHAFTPKEVAACRAVLRQPLRSRARMTIDSIYRARCGKDPDKPALGLSLVEMMFASTTRDPLKRPIVRFVKKVAELARKNHQPVTHAMWEFNQRTGYVGTLRRGAAAKRKHPFRPRKARAGKPRRPRARAVSAQPQVSSDGST